jgi:hypothetical protein
MRILAAVAVVAAFFILGQFRFLSIADVNPNLLLIGLLFFAFKTDRFRFLAILFAVSAVLAVLFTPAWFLQYAVILFVVLLFYFAKEFMTGSRFFDFLISVFLATALFYVIVNLFEFDLPYVLILGEVVYNLIIGTLIWYAAQKITN